MHAADSLILISMINQASWCQVDGQLLDLNLHLNDVKEITVSQQQYNFQGMLLLPIEVKFY